MLGADLFNCTPTSLGSSFKQATGATYPLLLNSATATGGSIWGLYGERDHYVVINKQGIVRYQANDRWAYGNGYHLDEIRGCVDSLVSAAVLLHPRPTLVRDPARRPRLEPASAAESGMEEALPMGAALRVGAEPSRSRVAFMLANPFGRSVEARVTVHDLAGRRVAMLLDGPAAPGFTTLVWDGRDFEGRAAASGIYHVHAELADLRLSRRIALVR